MKKTHVRLTIDEYQAGQAVPKNPSSQVTDAPAKSSKPIHQMPSFEQQVEEEINNQLKKKTK